MQRVSVSGYVMRAVGCMQAWFGGARYVQIAHACLCSCLSVVEVVRTGCVLLSACQLLACGLSACPVALALESAACTVCVVRAATDGCSAALRSAALLWICLSLLSSGQWHVVGPKWGVRKRLFLRDCSLLAGCVCSWLVCVWRCVDGSSLVHWLLRSIAYYCWLLAPAAAAGTERPTRCAPAAAAEYI